MPVFFRLSHEQALILYDELKNNSISNKIEKEFFQIDNETLIGNIDVEFNIIDLKKYKIHLSYNDLSQRTCDIIGTLLFIGNSTIAITYKDVGQILNLLGATVVPFMIYIIPGHYYYLRSK